jgi:hypothetical protein
LSARIRLARPISLGSPRSYLIIGKAPQRPGDLAQAAALREPPPDLLVPLHRHAPKRHAAVSFVVTHEGCGTQRTGSGDEDSDDGEGTKIDSAGRSQRHDRGVPLALDTPENASHQT